MEYTHRYPAYSTQEVAAGLERHIDIHRQAYNYHRDIPDEADIKGFIIKREATDEWSVPFGLETDKADLPGKPDVDSFNTTNSAGVDLGTLNYIHTSEGTAVGWLDFEDEYERTV